MKKGKTYHDVQIRINNIILSLGFLFILIVPVIQEYFTIIPQMESKENRKLVDKPVMEITYLDPFPGAYETYYSDHFSLRNQLVRLNSLMLVNTFRKSPMPDKVIFGKQGWLYLVRDELDHYRGTNLFKQDKLEEISSEILRRKEYLDTKGIKMYFAIAPTKYSIYPENLPFYVNKLDTITRTDQVISALNDEGIDPIDLRQALVEAKESGLLYYKTDNHWNNYGSFIAYNYIIQRIEKDFPALSKLTLQDFNVEQATKSGGNTAKLFAMEEEFEDIEFSLKKITPQISKEALKHGYKVPDFFPYEWEYELQYESGIDSLPDILFIRDSFGYYLMPYITESFNRSVCIFDAWHYTENKDIIENENPDIVLYVVLESLWDGFVDGFDNPN